MPEQQSGKLGPPPQAAPSSLQEPVGRQRLSRRSPVQQLSLVAAFASLQAAPWTAQLSAGRQVPSPQNPEQHCVFVVHVWVLARQQPLTSLHSRL